MQFFTSLVSSSEWRQGVVHATINVFSSIYIKGNTNISVPVSREYIKPEARASAEDSVMSESFEIVHTLVLRHALGERENNESAMLTATKETGRAKGKWPCTAIASYRHRLDAVTLRSVTFRSCNDNIFMFSTNTETGTVEKWFCKFAPFFLYVRVCFLLAIRNVQSISKSVAFYNFSFSS